MYQMRDLTVYCNVLIVMPTFLAITHSYQRGEDDLVHQAIDCIYVHVPLMMAVLIALKL